jgi:hypothetical protein
MSNPTLGSVEGFPARQPWNGRDSLAQQASPLGLCLLLVLGTWLLARRWAGAFEQPLELLGLIAAALLLSVWSGGVRWAWYACRRISPDRSMKHHHLVGVLTTAGVLEFGAALSLPGSSEGALMAFWCVLLASEAAWGFAFHASHSANSLARKAAGETQPAPSVIRPTRAEGATHSACEFPLIGSGLGDETGELLAAGESQRISRGRDSQGGEIISGLVRCSFEPGERQQDIHLAFCPPLKQIPHFSMEQLEGPPARLRASLVESFGVGLEVKLTSLSSGPASVQIQFFACEEAMADDSN